MFSTSTSLFALKERSDGPEGPANMSIFRCERDGALGFFARRLGLCATASTAKRALRALAGPPAGLARRYSFIASPALVAR